MLQHRYHPGLQGMTDVVGLDDGVGFGVELPLEVVEHRARAYHPRLRLPNGCSFCAG